MTYNEIILWRRFMESKGVLNNFEYLYLNHRFDKRDFNQFLEEVEAERVILSAFDFSATANSIFNYKSWKDLNAKWMVALNEFRENKGTNIPVTMVLCPHCRRALQKSAFAMKKNGKLHKYCKECESGAWDRAIKEKQKEEQEQLTLLKKATRLEKEYEERARSLNAITKVCNRCGERKLKKLFYASSSSEDGLQGWCIDCQNKFSNAANEMDKELKDTQTEPIEEHVCPPKLGEYDATFHYREKKKSITLNGKLSELLMKGQFTRCYLKQDVTKRVFLVFNRVEGANITTASTRKSMLYRVNSAEYCRILADKFRLPFGDSFYLHITRNLSKTNDVVTIEVLAARTKEEFTAAGQRMEEKELKAKQKLFSDSEPHEENNKETNLPVPQSQQEIAETIIQQIIDRNIVTERDLAAYLHNKGWKLEEPVTTYKKFTL